MRSSDRLRIRDDFDSVGARNPTSGRPSIVWNCAFAPTTSNIRGTMSICATVPCIRRMTSSVCSCESVENAIMTRSAAYCADETCEVVGVAEQRHGAGSVHGGPAVAIDESDDVEPVLGVLRDLVGEQPCHLARADDDHVLDVGRPAAADEACRCSGERHEHDRADPECHQARERRVRGPEEMRHGEECPGADGDDLEHAEEVVDGGVIAALLVPVVQAVDARDEDPEGQAQEEQGDLVGDDDAVGDGRVRRCERDPEQEGRDQPDHVRRHQQAPHQPAASAQRLLDRDTGYADTLGCQDSSLVRNCTQEPLRRCDRRRGEVTVSRRLTPRVRH